MEENSKILKLRVLLCFLKSDPEDCIVTGISRTLGEEKYSVSRIITALEREDYINCDDVRNPVLTEKGYRAAARYSDRLDVTLGHLLYEGATSKAQSATQCFERSAAQTAQWRR